MPKISEFYGISITLRLREKNHHLPHFHASYGEEEASISIGTLEILAGHLNRRALALVIEWSLQHRDELNQVWQDVKAGRVPQKIEPLQ